MRYLHGFLGYVLMAHISLYSYQQKMHESAPDCSSASAESGRVYIMLSISPTLLALQHEFTHTGDSKCFEGQ